MTNTSPMKKEMDTPPQALKVPTKKERKDATHRLKVDLKQAVNKAFKDVTTVQLEGALASYMQLMTAPDDAEEITMSPAEVQQAGLLCSQALSVILHERSK